MDNIFGLKYAMGATLILLAKYYIQNVIGVFIGSSLAGIRFPEDYTSKLATKAKSETGVKIAKLRARRFERLTGNDVENIPFGLILIWGSYLIRCQTGDWSWFKELIVAFVVARYAHSACLYKGLQPFRTLIFVCGMLSAMGLGVLSFLTLP